MYPKVREFALIFIDEKLAAEASGKSIKFTIMTVFSLNMLIKLVVSASASHLWSLIHVLQA